MSAAIGPKSWVQAIRDDRGHLAEAEIRKGNVYYVEAVAWSDLDLCGYCQTGDDILMLSTDTPPGFGWCVCSFKPLGGDHATESTGTRVTEPA